MLTMTSLGEEVKPVIKIDIGCGPHKTEGFVGMDRIAFDGVDHVLNIGKERWPFEDNTVTEAFTNHFVEHLTALERIHFANELCRVLIPGGKCIIIVPHWSAGRSYGDPTHQWPPMSEMWFYYLKKEWRESQAPHTDIKNWPQGFNCDFDATWGYGYAPTLNSRNDEMKQFAINYYREAIMDIHATLVKK